MKNSSPTSFSRRRFLQQGAGAAAGLLAVPFILRSTARGQGAPAANDRINLGLIGNGNIMLSHRGYYLSSAETRVTALCDVRASDLAKAKAYASEAGSECDTYGDYEELLARPDLDAVVIATPDHWHAAIAIAAMKAGKDVYVEKPMMLTIDEGKAMVAATDRYQRVLQVGSQQRSDSAFRRAAEMVRNGWIGEIKEVYAKLDEFPPGILEPEQPVPDGFDYDKWLGPAPFVPYYPLRCAGPEVDGWRLFWDYGSRRNGDWGSHHFDIIQWALDQDDSGPTLFVPKGYQDEPYQYHQYASGVRVIRDHPISDPFMIQFVGTEGVVKVGRHGQLATEPAELAARPLSPSDQRLEISDDHRANWLNCVRARTAPICNARVGNRSGSISALASIAERLGRPVHWDPDEQIITDDSEAARWMTRPRREGYGLPV